jgi:hypothetical protein
MKKTIVTISCASCGKVVYYVLGLENMYQISTREGVCRAQGNGVTCHWQEVSRREEGV